MAFRRVGYARVSTQEQDLALQLDALHGVGCSKVFEEKASGAQRDRPALKAALDYVREGDTLVVWKLDRLARSLKQLSETVATRGGAAGMRPRGYTSLPVGRHTRPPCSWPLSCPH
jgi:predicted site-specific integrase-resolvase